MRFKRLNVIAIFLIFAVLCASCVSNNDIDYSNSQYSEFIDNIIDAYSYSNGKAKLIKLDDDQGVFEVELNGRKRNILFDLKNENVLSTDYNLIKKIKI